MSYKFYEYYEFPPNLEGDQSFYIVNNYNWSF